MNTLRLIWGRLTWRGRLHLLWRDVRPRAWWRHVLVRRYPEMFRYKGWSDPMQSGMAFGFEHGDGWARVLWRMVRELRRVERATGVRTEICTVKEKYGTLRVYFNTSGHL